MSIYYQQGLSAYNLKDLILTKGLIEYIIFDHKGGLVIDRGYFTEIDSVSFLSINELEQGCGMARKNKNFLVLKWAKREGLQVDSKCLAYLEILEIRKNARKTDKNLWFLFFLKIIKKNFQKSLQV